MQQQREDAVDQIIHLQRIHVALKVPLGVVEQGQRLPEHLDQALAARLLIAQHPGALQVAGEPLRRYADAGDGAGRAAQARQIEAHHQGAEVIGAVAIAGARREPERLLRMDHLAQALGLVADAAGEAQVHVSLARVVAHGTGDR